jgi:hypothetical protein
MAEYSQVDKKRLWEMAKKGISAAELIKEFDIRDMAGLQQVMQELMRETGESVAVLNEVHHGADMALTYGAGVARDNDMPTVYSKTIVDRGSVHAQIEMTRGKARLLIRSRKETRT